MSQTGTKSDRLVSGWKDEALTVEAGSLDTEELKAAPIAVSYRDADTADRSVTKSHGLDHADVLAGEPVGLFVPHILNPKVDVRRHVATLSINPSMASQQNGS